jgi:hypothetical protein
MCEQVVWPGGRTTRLDLLAGYAEERYGAPGASPEGGSNLAGRFSMGCRTKSGSPGRMFRMDGTGNLK